MKLVLQSRNNMKMASYSQALKTGLNMSYKPPVVDYQKSFSSGHNWRVGVCKISGSDRTVLIPRIQFIPKSGEFPFEWRRRQFPVKPAFATTVNKSQGQTLKFIGIWLRTPIFTHGQLYVACSRVGKPEQLKFAIKLDSLGNVPRVDNVVFQEVLLDQ